MIELLLLLPTQPVTVAEALQAMRSAYDTAVVADSMTYETRRSDGTFDAVSAVLRIAADEAGQQLRYETNGFVFHARSSDAAGTLTGAGLGPPEPRRVLVAERPNQSAAQMLTGIIPTGPLPQLWTIEGSRVTDPSLGAIRFTAASIDRGTISIIGDTVFGPLRLQTDAATGRCIMLRAPLRDGAIELRASPAEPGDPRTWPIDTDRRRIVERIDQLAPSLAVLRAGDLLPDVSLQHADGAGLSLVEWHESPPNTSQRSPWSLILFVDATSTDPGRALSLAVSTLEAIGREAATRRAAAAPAKRFWLRYRPLVVLVLPEEAAFDTQPPRPDAPGVDVLYSTRPDLTVDRLPLASLVAVAIDRDRVIGAVSATNNGAEAPLLVDQLVAPASNASE